jgi:hypothetical protein
VVVTTSANSEIVGACLRVVGIRPRVSFTETAIALPCKNGRRSYPGSIDPEYSDDPAALWWWIVPSQWRPATPAEIARAQLDRLAGDGL